jgi:hypothetical protein
VDVVSRGKFSIGKRRRQEAERERVAERATRRDQRSEKRKSRTTEPGVDGEDPDLAGIVPGPQPTPSE